MPGTTLLVALVALGGSQSDTPPTDYATGVRLPASQTYARLSSDWALAYNAQPKLVETSTAVEASATTGGSGDPVVDPASATETQSQYGPHRVGGVGPDNWSNLHDRTLADLSLDWGLATIGPGVLTPQAMGAGGGAGGTPGGGGGGRSGSGIPGSSGPTFIFPPVPDPPAPPNPGGQQVPEPASVGLWSFVLAVAALLKRRWPKNPAVVTELTPAAA